MITTCPSCSTRFQVTPEQLAARQGLVRCGRCAMVFNGFSTLQREDTKNITPQAKDSPESFIHNPSESIEHKPLAASWTPTTDGKGSKFHALQGHIERSPPRPIWTPCDATIVFSSQQDEHAAVSTSNDSEQILKESVGSLATARPDIESQQIAETVPAAISHPKETILIQPELNKPAHVKSGRWVIVCLLLATTLAGQSAYLIRTEIAAYWPATRPYLTRLCERLGCVVPLPKQIDLVTIEASEMQADTIHPNVLIVTATLRNRSTVSQTYPLLEVTLTDTLERAVARRTLTATEYLDRAPNENEGIAPNGEAATRTIIETVDIKPAGYRLQLYYR